MKQTCALVDTLSNNFERFGAVAFKFVEKLQTRRRRLRRRGHSGCKSTSTAAPYLRSCLKTAANRKHASKPMQVQEEKDACGGAQISRRDSAEWSAVSTTNLSHDFQFDRTCTHKAQSTLARRLNHSMKYSLNDMNLQRGMSTACTEYWANEKLRQRRGNVSYGRELRLCAEIKHPVLYTSRWCIYGDEATRRYGENVLHIQAMSRFSDG